MVFISSLWFSLLPILPLFFMFLFLSKKKAKEGDEPFLPPGPPKLPIVGNLRQLRDMPHRALSKLSETWGPIMLMQLGSKPTLVVSSAELAKVIFKTHDLHFCSRTTLTAPKRLSYNFGDMASSPHGEYWKEAKKICVRELFSVKRVQSFKCVREEEVALMMNSIIESSSRPINLSETLLSVTTNITCRVAFGKKYERNNYEGGEKFHEAIHDVVSLLGSFAAADFFPYYGWIIDRLTGFNTKLEKCFHAFDNFYQYFIDEHRDPRLRIKPEQEDFLAILLRLSKDPTVATPFTTDDHIKGILMNIFLGGVVTNAAVLVWAMTELVRHPEAMKKVQEEIRNCVGAKGMVEETDIYHLPYLKMVIKETLRVHPPAPLLIPRESMSYCKVGGYDIYPKTRLLVNVWAISRSTDYWENPEKFIPERFINSSTDYKGQDFEFTPFGSGRRICPGMNLAIALIELALANLLYTCNWELPSGTTKEDINMDEISALAVHKKLPLHLVPVKYTLPSSK